MTMKINSLIYTTLLLLSLVSCGEKDTENKSEEKVRTNVEISVLKPENFSNYLETIGIVYPQNDIPLIAEESGKVLQIVLEKGQSVEKGQLIAVLENKVLQAQMRQTKAAYSSDSLNYEQQKELKKVNGISDVALKQAEYRRDMSRANYSLLKTRYAKLWIKAPISGILDQLFFDRGAYVPPMSRFGHLVDINKIKVTVDMPERYAGKINKKNRVEISFGAYNDELFDGKISFVGNVVEPKSRTFPIEIFIDNSNKKLKPNMLANVLVQLYEYSGKVVIPKDAVIDEGENLLAFVKQGGVARERRIEIEDVYRDKALISQGLSFNDSLIVLGNRDLVDSTAIRVLKKLEN